MGAFVSAHLDGGGIENGVGPRATPAQASARAQALATPEIGISTRGRWRGGGGAPEATEISTIVPVVLRGAKQLVLVGDHCQLPPSVISREARPVRVRRECVPVVRALSARKVSGGS